jgi:hypothetical protein
MKGITRIIDDHLPHSVTHSGCINSHVENQEDVPVPHPTVDLEGFFSAYPSWIISLIHGLVEGNIETGKSYISWESPWFPVDVPKTS